MADVQHAVQQQDAPEAHIMFKAMLLAAKDFDSRDFLACDLFKRLLPFARDHC